LLQNSLHAVVPFCFSLDSHEHTAAPSYPRSTVRTNPSLAFKRTGEPNQGHFGEPILRTFGIEPENLDEL
jgi:hypothetical protein